MLSCTALSHRQQSLSLVTSEIAKSLWKWTMSGHFVAANCCPRECLLKPGFYFLQAWFFKGITKKKINLVLVSTLRTQTNQSSTETVRASFLKKSHLTFIRHLNPSLNLWPLGLCINFHFFFLHSKSNTQQEDFILVIKSTVHSSEPRFLLCLQNFTWSPHKKCIQHPCLILYVQFYDHTIIQGLKNSCFLAAKVMTSIDMFTNNHSYYKCTLFFFLN